MMRNRNLRENKLVTVINPKSPISEAYRTLRTNIQFSNIDKELKTIMVTSSGPAEGKTTTASNLAVVMSQDHKRVLLVDCDLRRPTVHHAFAVPNRIGVTNVLIGSTALDLAVQSGPIDNLQILPSGPIPPNPAELLSSKRMGNLLDELQDQYDLVLLDAPPVLAVTDAQILASKVDGVLLVVKSGHTDRGMALKAKAMLDNVHANIMGIVLNNRKANRGHYYYYYRK
ncbi:CpsD/CapB family tyrosine-protein kinase [Effusibacillus consociatus]|uniref:non-specific protein-tyrosine kinase n=1 Tax=Effusibacillus consociatus TaxID=1117041 RepID=A0ABV9Q6E8_9BACL